jgi:hypothetical protein
MLVATLLSFLLRQVLGRERVVRAVLGEQEDGIPAGTVLLRPRPQLPHQRVGIGSLYPGPQVPEAGLNEGQHAGAVLALERAELIHAALKLLPLLHERTHRLAVTLLGISLQALSTCTRVAGELFSLLLRQVKNALDDAPSRHRRGEDSRGVRQQLTPNAWKRQRETPWRLRGRVHLVDPLDRDHFAVHPVHHPVGADPEPVVAARVESLRRVRVALQGVGGGDDGPHALLVAEVPLRGGRCLG